jgi:hypothetical protein
MSLCKRSPWHSRGSPRALGGARTCAPFCDAWPPHIESLSVSKALYLLPNRCRSAQAAPSVLRRAAHLERDCASIQRPSTVCDEEVPRVSTGGPWFCQLLGVRGTGWSGRYIVSMRADCPAGAAGAADPLDA